MRQLESLLDPLTLNSFRKQLTGYDQLCSESETRTENVMYAPEKKYGCYICGGNHPYNQCWLKETCDICGRRGHP